MKTKKALAVVLAIVMLVMPLAVTSFAADGILINPIKTEYYDTDYFNPQGLKISYAGKEIEYSPTDADFRFDPALDVLLTVTEDETGMVLPSSVSVYYENSYIGEVEIIVNHKIDTQLSIINNGHGYYCLGCGKLHNFQKHTVDEWIPNDDGGLFVLQTQTGTCTVCGAEVTETIPGSNSFMSSLGWTGMTETEAMILNYFHTIVASLIQMLVGIS